ncbi:alpha-amylase family glycosyl hydrolase [uncultured Deefgea sp.]|uniref:alpha-amylase family glycosyl hydrolase n=1 Tax=uncultured Deefgea sp. TaxID=1304914 RepID=UPI0025922C2B|nr:alpha-amylase family glycosyl hydrolase [uncultured Deefgea sp.]
MTQLDDLTRRRASQIVYQIFPERFAIGGGLSSAEKLAHAAYDGPNIAKRDWDDSTLNQPWGQQFFGGDLAGIADKIDYLLDLGVTGVYLTPIFSAPSNHKYDATDFFTIDAMFGGETALLRLIDTLHQQGMNLTLDAVLNHVSELHPWFLAAQQGDPSKRDWFTFLADGRYLCWQDYGLMPELNLANPAVRDVLYRQPNSVVQYWLSRGIDNWRFDVAQDVGIPVAQEMAALVGNVYPEAGLLGELNGFSGGWFQAGAGYSGMMNYWYRTAILAWLAGEIDGVQMNAAIQDARDAYGLEGLLCSWNMLSSHDTPRLITTVGNLHDAQLAMAMQFTLPGIPLVYYGEEIGMQGGADPDCRRPMRWNEADWNHAQRAWVKQLIAIRQQNTALQYGDVIVLGHRLAGNTMVFLRFTDVPGVAALVVVNLADTPLASRLLIPYSHWYDGVPLRDALGGAPDCKMQAGSVLLQLPARSVAIYQAFEPYQNYTFFKPRNQ